MDIVHSCANYNASHCTKNWIYHYSKPVDNAAFGRKYDQMRHYLKFTLCFL
jgi:hypothetical protein